MSGSAVARQEIRRARRQRRWSGLGGWVMIAMAVVLWAMVNYVASRYYARGIVSKENVFELSEDTRERVRMIDQPVTVTLLLESNHRDFNYTSNLLREYEALNPNVHVVRVDPEWHKAKASELVQRYKLRPNIRDEESGQGVSRAVIFDAEPSTRVVPIEDVVLTAVPTAEEREREQRKSKVIEHRVAQRSRKWYNGEQEFTGALHAVTNRKFSKVYFLQGNGERDVDEFGDSVGYGSARKRLELDNMTVAPLLVGSVSRLPEDCELLVIAGPRERIAASDLDMIERYLENNGRVMVLLDSNTDTGLEERLEAWGIRVGRDVVIDPVERGAGTVTVERYRSHPVTAGLNGYAATFMTPRSVRGMEESDEELEVVTLAASRRGAWAETDETVLGAVYDAGKDEEGPVGLGVAVTHGDASGGPAQETRLVVFGDSFFAQNSQRGGALELFGRSAAWLLNREADIQLPRRPMQEMRLGLTPEKSGQLYVLFLVGLPGLGMLLGLMVWMRRRA